MYKAAGKYCRPALRPSIQWMRSQPFAPGAPVGSARSEKRDAATNQRGNLIEVASVYFRELSTAIIYIKGAKR
jgi:hypothetical protein